ncbi:MAG: hemolysin family protein [Elusimicrobia bacterium]|nr:hemolysin family protein [Elusimicrobiota bacterium]
MYVVDVLYVILIMAALILAMSFASVVEMSFASLNRARVKSMAENGDKRAALVLKLHGRFDEIITTMLVCGYGLYFLAATMSTFWFMQFMGETGAVASGIVMTVLAVVLTDDFPKSMAKQAPEKFALHIAPYVWVMITVLKPVNLLLVKAKKFLNAKFLPKEKVTEEVGFRGEELLYVVEEAQEEGLITEADSLRISNAIEFNDLLVEDILTPRANILGVPKSASIEEVSDIFVKSGYSRLPVYEENIDNIVGVVYIKNFLKCTASKAASSLENVIAPVIYTALITQAAELFKLLQKKKMHMAIVVDEFGGTQGLVTMDDILKQIVGDIWDESDEYIEKFTNLGNNQHKVICTADIYEMFKYFGIEGEADSLTVGGWITDTLGGLAKKGDNFEYKNIKITVTKASPKRAEECIVEVKSSSTDKIENPDKQI